MKTFSIHLVRNVLALFIALGLGYVAYTVSPNSVEIAKVEAGSLDNVSGFVWSKGTGANTYSTTGTADPVGGPYTAGSNPGVGWISLNSLDCDVDGNNRTDSGACGGNNSTTIAQNYGVNISPLTGIGSFSGSAWSPNEPDLNGNPTGQGWISFNRAVTGSPVLALGDPGLSQTGTPLAYVDWSTGNVYGWARAIVACEDNFWSGTICTSPSFGDTAGNWDGWIKLSDASWANGVTISPTDGKFSGLAFGGEVIGWIDFAPTVGGVPISNQAKVVMPVACTETNPAFIGWSTCVAPASSCVSGGDKVQSGLTGSRYTTCSDPSTTVYDNNCLATSTTCSAGTGTAGAASWFKGDGVCTPPGENSTNSLSDCKPKTKFWQF